MWPSYHVWQIRLQPRASVINLQEAQVLTWLLRHPLVVLRLLQSAPIHSCFNPSECCWVQRDSWSLALKSMCSCPPKLNKVFIGRMNREWLWFWVPSGCPLLSWSQLCLVPKFLCNPSKHPWSAKMSLKWSRPGPNVFWSLQSILHCQIIGSAETFLCIFHEKHSGAQMLHENQI